MSPQGAAHAVAVRLAASAMQRAFASGHVVSVQLPMALAANSEPEPDVSVTPGSPRDFLGQHPATAVIVVEVSDTTLDYDRGPKAGLYAQAGIPEYWILDLADRVLEVHREPVAMAGQPFGHHYRSINRHTGADALTLLGAPGISIRVADLLP